MNNNNTLLEQFFMQKEQEKGSFLSSSPPVHDIRLTSRGGAHQTQILIYPSRDCRHGAQVCDEQTLVYIVLITSLQLALALVLISSCWGQVLSTTHFFDFSHTSNTAATLFRIPFQGTQLMLVCVLLFWKSCSTFLKGLKFCV